MGGRALALLAFSAPCLLAACSSDLFHDTGWPTLCDRDPAACAVSEQDAGEDGTADAGLDSSGDAAPEATSDGSAADSGDAKAGD